MNNTAIYAPVEGRPRRRDSFHLGLALAMTGTAYLGFWFTYFGPMFGGTYPQVSPLVHVHGWSFFIWYLLLPIQAGLIRLRRVATHQFLGLSSLGLGAIMIVAGLIVSAVQVDLAHAPDGSPFWQLMGVPIFSIWLLFTCFYVAAMYRRRNRIVHRQLIVLASAVALAAAIFRVLVQLFGFSPVTAIAGCLATVIFVLPAMIHDYQHRQSVSRVYLVGGISIIVLIGGSFALTMTPGIGAIESGIAWIGEALGPLYMKP